MLTVFLRGRTNAIQHDFLVLLEVELGVFGRNREHIIFLSPESRSGLHEFVNNCAVKRAEIGNFLTEFYRQNALANQLAGSGQAPQGQHVRQERPPDHSQRQMLRLISFTS